jgi:hypothetical protein
LSLFLFSSHALAWGIVVSFSCLVVFCFNSVNETIKKASAFFVIVPLVVLWVSSTNPDQSTSVIEAGRYSQHIFNEASRYVTYFVDMFNERTEQGLHKERLLQFFSFTIGKDNLPDYVIVGAFLAFSPLLYGAKITRHWKRWLPFIFTFTAFMLVPYWLLNTAYINERFSLFCFLSLLFAYEKRELHPGSDDFFNRRNLFLGLTGVIVFAVLCSHLQTLTVYKEDDRDFKQIISRIQENKWVMALIYDTEPHPLISPSFQHYPKWYAAEKVGKVNYSFSMDPVVGHSVPLQYKGESRPVIDPWDPSGFNWQEHRGYMYDYFLVRSDKRVDHIFAESNNDVVLISQAGKWLLYGKRALLN